MMVILVRNEVHFISVGADRVETMKLTLATAASLMTVLLLSN